MSTFKIILKNILLQRRTLLDYVTTSLIYFRTRLIVQDGIFKGMNYVENSKGGAYFPKLLGTYEKELNSTLEFFLTKDFSKIINVGGGEGYFAVGLAILSKKCEVEVFEPDFFACYLIEKLAKLNGVYSQMKINAKLCLPLDLESALEKNAHNFIFMDVEGAELVLLDPSLVPSLKFSSIIVEIHDTVSPILGETIKNRFLSTHHFTEIWSKNREISDLKILPAWKRILSRNFIKMMDEGRGSKMRWFVFERIT